MKTVLAKFVPRDDADVRVTIVFNQDDARDWLRRYESHVRLYGMYSEAARRVAEALTDLFEDA